MLGVRKSGVTWSDIPEDGRQAMTDTPTWVKLPIQPKFPSYRSDGKEQEKHRVWLSSAGGDCRFQLTVEPIGSWE